MVLAVIGISWLSTLFKSGDINKRIKDKLYSDLKIENPYNKGKIDRFKDFVKSHK
jgi:hypothetical protein